MKDSIQQIASNFFDKLGVEYSELTIIQEAEKIFLIKIKSTDSNILIGPHGKNIDFMGSILKLLVSRTSGEHIVIHLEVNDYMKQKDEKLLSYIQTKIDLVESSGTEIKLPFFTAYERKKVHSYVSEQAKSAYTKSIGEGHDRRIHLCKKDSKMTIDIDGDDI